MSELIHKIPKLSLFYKIKNILQNLLVTESSPMFTLHIPNNTLYRTELICKYISDEQGYDFGLENFLMLLYLDFIQDAIKHYNPHKIFELLKKSYYTSETIILSNGIDTYSIDKVDLNVCNLTITMSESDVKKGELILNEIYELYRYRFQFSKLLESLWLNFIEGYKCGDNKRAYHSMVNLLKKCFSDIDKK